MPAHQDQRREQTETALNEAEESPPTPQNRSIAVQRNCEEQRFVGDWCFNASLFYGVFDNGFYRATMCASKPLPQENSTGDQKGNRNGAEVETQLYSGKRLTEDADKAPAQSTPE